jgi:hypothetical protein
MKTPHPDLLPYFRDDGEGGLQLVVIGCVIKTIPRKHLLVMLSQISRHLANLEPHKPLPTGGDHAQ